MKTIDNLKHNFGVMAERLLRSTVNTFFIGSIPINALYSRLFVNFVCLFY